MKTLKVMSIIGILFFTRLILIYGLGIVEHWNHPDFDWRFFAVLGLSVNLFALMLSIAILIKSFKKTMLAKISMKAVSVFSVVFFTIAFLIYLVTYIDYSKYITFGPSQIIWHITINGMLYTPYALSLSIVMLVKSNKKRKIFTNANVADELLKLSELKEKGIITEEEFDAKKAQLL